MFVSWPLVRCPSQEVPATLCRVLHSSVRSICRRLKALGGWQALTLELADAVVWLVCVAHQLVCVCVCGVWPGVKGAKSSVRRVL